MLVGSALEEGVPMKSYVSGMIALVSVVSLLAPAEAIAAPARCAQVKSCSQAHNGCRRNCFRPGTGRCIQFCGNAYRACMQTGTFKSVWCGNLQGLQRR